MKNKLRFLGFIGLASTLVSCGSSPFDDDISFLNEHGVAFYYCGNESNIFSKIDNYFELSTTNLPEAFPLMSSFVIDVSNMSHLITENYLDELFSFFNHDKYVYVMFANFNKDLSFLANSYFAEAWGQYDKELSEDLVVFYNNGRHDYLSISSFSFSYTNERGYTIENYQKSIVNTYCEFVKNALLDS